ncbi:two-component system chemotaxis sensor kinase CheA [Pseudomonas duriflava]|uniref:Chemotaxis protein CheA n=1 Tax=Pseudomonas duriflava TaxID=459528 RepID=A0A562Q7K6_9PSED|nr:chemotaxis protein CheA [Pseudomonas duriflava]TWI52723.1 two-component system chemotaxis sensor kinase CheA [Pseudomonas duriflava]
MNALLQQFIQESREGLEAISSTLLEMERAPGDTAAMGELFRLVHTLKGNSGLFGFPALTRVLHAGEDVMDAVRNGELSFSQTLADQLLNMADYVSVFLDEVEQNGEPGEAFQTPPRELVTALRAWLESGERTTETPPAISTSVAALPVPAWTEDLPEEVRQAVAGMLREGLSVFRVEYQPASDCFFQGTDPLHLVRQLPAILWRRISPLQPWAPTAELDAYQCNLRIELVLSTREEELAEHFRYVSDQVTWEAVSLAAIVQEPQSSPVVTSALSAVDPLVMDIVRTQQVALSACLAQPWLSGQQAAIVRTLGNALSGHDMLLQYFQQSLDEANRQASSTPLMAWLQAELEASASEAGEVHEECSLARDIAGEWPSAQLEPSVAAMQGVSEAVPVAAESASARRQDDTGHVTPKVLKIEQEKIDRLMNLIGEIVVAKNGLPYLAERAENQYGQRDLAREIKAQYAVVNRIAEDLQDAIMQVRMMPVSFVLQRFPRLVRDIARKLGKKVNLVLEGEDTEADKSMIEALADPLVHIVRNSMDHGLELPEERVKAGKPETGTLRIRANQNADHVVITIEDDGRGIDPQRIKGKVASKGLVEHAALEAMNDQELINLVFLPGFSTAEQISDLSGRGVGMDVVRSGIEKVGGQMRLSSQVGKGTQLSLTLPLSMAVTQVMVIESGGQRFGIPMDQVMETVRLPKASIHTIKHQPTAQLRGRTIPLKSLNQMLAVSQEQILNEDDEYALMVLRSRGELVGLIIDDFHGSIDIILKPMVGILGELSGYSGTAVMGDGSILMILNPTELFE